MIRRIAVLALIVAAMTGVLPRASEGQNKAPGGSGAPASGRQILTAASDRYELLLKIDRLWPGEETDLELFVGEFETNAPVVGAAITLSLHAGSRELWSRPARPADNRPGVYTAAFQAPPDTGSFNMFATVERLGDQDRFVLSGLKVTAREPAGRARSRGGPRWPWIVGAGVVVLAALFALSRRRTRPGSAAVVLGVLLAANAWAHAGHDDAPGTSGVQVGPGSQVYVAKESQFLLGIRTETVKRQQVQRRLTVLGRVAPRGGGEVVIVAPQSGRIYFGGSQAPVIGQAVGKGQAVARLTVVDDLDLRAPITGVITGVFVVQGQLVEAGQKLMTLLDPSVVWVHADVYEQDVPSVQHSTRAVISSQTTPELAFSGRRVAIGVTQGEVLGTVEAWFEVPNPGGHLKVGALVDVSIEQGGTNAMLVIPRSAVFDKEGRKLVFLHTAPERFTAKEVTLGTSLGMNVAVSGELTPGDRIVTAGGYSLLTAPVVGR